MNGDSVKARLKNYAICSGCTFQEALIYYGLERTIYRISVSPYADRFILKGGILLYAAFNGKYERATTDIDLLAQRISNSASEMRIVFREILSQIADDALVFDLDSISVENIAEFREYHGLHIFTVAYLDRTRIPVEIDIGFGDIVYPESVKLEFPVILGTKSFNINSYSLESSIAEKLEAIIHNGFTNSRYKDFYDIYVLSKTHSFMYRNLQGAIIETFLNRNTPMTMNPYVFSDAFINDEIHQTRWKAFLKKKKAMIPVPINEAFHQIKAFAAPLLEGTCSSKAVWYPAEGSWKEP